MSIEEILTHEESFIKTVQNSFFSVMEANEVDESKGSKNFLNYIKGDYKERKEGEYYMQCLQGLQKSYSREILLRVLSDGPETLDNASQELFKNPESF